MCLWPLSRARADRRRRCDAPDGYRRNRRGLPHSRASSHPCRLVHGEWRQLESFEAFHHGIPTTAQVEVRLIGSSLPVTHVRKAASLVARLGLSPLAFRVDVGCQRVRKREALTGLKFSRFLTDLVRADVYYARRSTRGVERGRRGQHQQRSRDITAHQLGRRSQARPRHAARR